jgi:hypothetical protein
MEMRTMAIRIEVNKGHRHHANGYLAIGTLLPRDLVKRSIAQIPI